MGHSICDLEHVLADVVEINDPAQRQAFVEHACAGDAALRAQVERLLGNHDRAGSFLEQPAAISAKVPLPTWGEAPGAKIGPYKLLEVIGEGGMGVVYLAEQQEPVRRDVALKVIKPGMDSKQVVARFEAERQALAMMDHPNIARVLDAGTIGARGQGSGVSNATPAASSLTPDPCTLTPAEGRPYFVMELVRGIPITEYCDQAHMTVRQRLEAFIQVCRAVQHAHTKGIIHRDLKPGNVLVTSHDGVPVPKVIDFGVAKALEQPLTERTLHTGFAQLIGTPLYMSPEQAEFNLLGVDTRSDIYSLGVMLYELLTGSTPFCGERLRSADFDEMRRILREEEPPRPSKRLSTLGAALSTVSQRRGVDSRKLSQTVHGELDWIVLKALEKDRTRRYETASALAADVQRYLNDEPVEACPPSRWYRLRKLARRQRRSLVTASILVFALVAATAVSAWQAVAAQDAQHQAEADRELAKAAEKRATIEAAVATAVSDFLQQDLLRQVDAYVQRDDGFTAARNLTVKEALDRAAAKIGQRFKDQPLVEAKVQMTIGEAYRTIGEFQLAVPHLERAAELRRTHLGPDHPDTFASMHSLALTCEWVGRVPDAIALHQQLLEKQTTALGPNHPETLARMGSLAISYRKAGQWDKSMKLFEQLLEKQTVLNGAAHRATLGTMHFLAMNFGDMGRLAESSNLHEKVLELHSATLPPDDPGTLWVMQSCAGVYEKQEKFVQAEGLLREGLEHSKKHNNFNGRIRTANILVRLGLNLMLQQDCPKAEPLFREALVIFEKERPDHWARFHCMSVLGDLLSCKKEYAEAEPLLLQGYEGMKNWETFMLANEKRGPTEAAERVVHFYEAAGQTEKARICARNSRMKNHSIDSRPQCKEFD